MGPLEAEKPPDLLCADGGAQESRWRRRSPGLQGEGPVGEGEPCPALQSSGECTLPDPLRSPQASQAGCCHPQWKQRLLYSVC